MQEDKMRCFFEDTVCIHMDKNTIIPCIAVLHKYGRTSWVVMLYQMRTLRQSYESL